LASSLRALLPRGVDSLIEGHLRGFQPQSLAQQLLYWNLMPRHLAVRRRISMNQPAILVVGATGRLGSRLLHKLAAAGVKPRALVRNPEKGALIASLATPVIGDLRSPETLADAFRGSERVFIVAPPAPDMETLERNAIEATVAAGSKRIVYLSNFAATENDEDRFVHIHGLHQNLVTTLGIEWTVLRPTRYMTSFPFVWRSIFEQNLLIETGGLGAMTCIDPDDVATIAAKTLMEDSHIRQMYKLTSEETYTAAELAALLSRVLKRNITVFQGDTEALRDALIANGAKGEHAPFMARYFAKVAAGLYTTTDTASNILGRSPHAYAEWIESNRPATS